MGESSSSSTSWSSQKDNTEDDRMIALMLSEEYTKLDGAVARRLSNLAPVPVSLVVVSLLTCLTLSCSISVYVYI